MLEKCDFPAPYGLKPYRKWVIDNGLQDTVAEIVDKKEPYWYYPESLYLKDED